MATGLRSVQTFFGLRYLSRFLDWTQSRWDKTKFTMKAFPTFERGCHEKHLLLAGVNIQYSGLEVLFDKCSILWSWKAQAFFFFFFFFHRKKIVRTQSKHMVEMKKGMAGPALAPGFLESKSWIFTWIPQAHMDSSWAVGTGWGAQHTTLSTVFRFHNFRKSQVPWQRDTWLSLFGGMKKNLEWSF